MFQLDQLLTAWKRSEGSAIPSANMQSTELGSPIVVLMFRLLCVLLRRDRPDDSRLQTSRASILLLPGRPASIFAVSAGLDPPIPAFVGRPLVEGRLMKRLSAWGRSRAVFTVVAASEDASWVHAERSDAPRSEIPPPRCETGRAERPACSASDGQRSRAGDAQRPRRGIPASAGRPLGTQPERSCNPTAPSEKARGSGPFHWNRPPGVRTVLLGPSRRLPAPVEGTAFSRATYATWCVILTARPSGSARDAVPGRTRSDRIPGGLSSPA